MTDLGIEISSSNSHFIRAQVAPALATKELTIGVQELSEENKKIVQELKKRDAEVRRHEQAHKAMAGPYAIGGPTYEYVQGPDGKQYAVGGEVQIDASEVNGDPEATIRKARTVKRAALAPMDPSMQDRRVAAEATQMEAKARQELANERKEELQTYNDTGTGPENSDTSVVDLFV